MTEDQITEIRNITRKVNEGYKLHRLEFHPEKDLPIQRIMHAIYANSEN